jgi:hypothetical protein
MLAEAKKMGEAQNREPRRGNNTNALSGLTPELSRAAKRLRLE